MDQGLKDLTTRQRARIERYKNVLGVVEPTAIGITLYNIGHDEEPSKEISRWELIARVLESTSAKRRARTFAEKESEFFMLVLLVTASIVPENASHLSYVLRENIDKAQIALERIQLTGDEIGPVLRRYDKKRKAKARSKEKPKTRRR